MGPNRYYMTFGQKYRREAHPTIPREWANPDGYIAIYADTINRARAAFQSRYGNNFCSIYSEHEFLSLGMDKYYPEGGLAFFSNGCWTSCTPRVTWPVRQTQEQEGREETVEEAGSPEAESPLEYHLREAQAMLVAIGAPQDRNEALQVAQIHATIAMAMRGGGHPGTSSPSSTSVPYQHQLNANAPQILRTISTSSFLIMQMFVRDLANTNYWPTQKIQLIKNLRNNCSAAGITLGLKDAEDIIDYSVNTTWW